jgi:hypothetical protein
VFFSEKRPFFMEGSGIFTLRPSIRISASLERDPRRQAVLGAEPEISFIVG